jgi:Tol biopolymer transport system component
VTTAGAAGISTRPNGRIAYDRADPASPGDTLEYTANPDGTAPRQLLPQHACCASWSHDGRKLAVAMINAHGTFAPATVNADGSGLKLLQMADPTLNVGCGGAWSPDDKRLACESWDDSNPSRNGVYTVSTADGSGLKRVTANRVGGHDQPGAYSPTGKRLVFARFDANDNSLGLFVVRTNGKGVRRITPPGTLIQDGNDGDWSPRGNEIIFSRHVTPDARGSLWIVRPDGHGLHELKLQGLTCGGTTSDPNGLGCHEPHWSPDGKKIIFAANSSAGGRNIYIANADGTGVTEVAHDGDDDDPTWGSYPSQPPVGEAGGVTLTQRPHHVVAVVAARARIPCERVMSTWWIGNERRLPCSKPHSR